MISTCKGGGGVINSALVKSTNCSPVFCKGVYFILTGTEKRIKSTFFSFELILNLCTFY